MPSKGDRTRDDIVVAAAPIFNVRGYAGTSISSILEATGLEKGGLYRHFRSKNDLALAAFDYAVRILRARYDEAQAIVHSPYDRLIACIDVVAESVRRPALAGGCPILNTAIEADDTHVGLRARAAAAMNDWQLRIAAIATDAVACGELRAQSDPPAIAAIVTASLEGAIVTTTLLGDPGQMSATAAHLRTWLASLRVSRDARSGGRRVARRRR